MRSALDGEYVIRSLSLAWTDKEEVEYQAQFGSAAPNLETYLRLIDQRTRWKSLKPVSGVPLPGSVTDDSIAPSASITRASRPSRRERYRDNLGGTNRKR